MSSKEEVLTILEVFASTETMGSFFLENQSLDFLFIRPSGNPIDAKGFQDMWSSGDLVLESAEITKVHKFELLISNIELCFLTLGSIFTYKGTQNDDLLTVVRFKMKIDKKCKVEWRQNLKANQI